MKGLKPRSGVSASMQRDMSNVLRNLNNDMAKNDAGEVSTKTLDDLARLNLQYQLEKIDSSNYDAFGNDVLPEPDSNLLQHSTGS